MKFLNFFSKKKTLCALAVINILLIAMIFYFKRDLEILDEKFFYLKSEIQPLLIAQGEVGRALYMKINVIDFAFIISYTLFFVGAYFYFFKEMAQILVIIPLLLASVDIAETSIIFYLLKTFPLANSAAEYFLMFITPLKWILALSSLLAIINGYLVNLYMKKTS